MRFYFTNVKQGDQALNKALDLQILIRYGHMPEFVRFVETCLFVSCVALFGIAGSVAVSAKTEDDYFGVRFCTGTAIVLSFIVWLFIKLGISQRKKDPVRFLFSLNYNPDFRPDCVIIKLASDKEKQLFASGLTALIKRYPGLKVSGAELLA